MQNIVIHPLEENPLIQAYQLRNFELSVLMGQNPDMTPWLYNKHINCVYYPKSIGFDHIMYDNRWYEREGIVDVFKMRLKKSISEISCINIFDITKELIALGY